MKSESNCPSYCIECYISFETEGLAYKKHIQDKLNVDVIYKSLDTAISSTDQNYIMRKIRENYLISVTPSSQLYIHHQFDHLFPSTDKKYFQVFAFVPPLVLSKLTIVIL